MNNPIAPSRRNFFSNIGMGLSGIALASLLQQDGYAKEHTWSPPDGKPHFVPKAKNVIWLFMNGGVSHISA